MWDAEMVTRSPILLHAPVQCLFAATPIKRESLFLNPLIWICSRDLMCPWALTNRIWKGGCALGFVHFSCSWEPCDFNLVNINLD